MRVKYAAVFAGNAPRRGGRRRFPLGGMVTPVLAAAAATALIVMLGFKAAPLLLAAAGGTVFALTRETRGSLQRAS